MAKIKTVHPSNILNALGIDTVTGEYSYEGGVLEVKSVSSAKLSAASASLDPQAIAILAHNTLLQGQIQNLEQSIDTSRMRREVFEGMRKQVSGVSPTAAEAWSIAKVQSVDNEIAILRAKLK